MSCEGLIGRNAFHPSPETGLISNFDNAAYINMYMAPKNFIISQGATALNIKYSGCNYSYIISMIFKLT